MKYGIKICSKHTGEEIYLGGIYDTFEEAEKVAQRDVCPRCNRWSIIKVREGDIWINKNIGFGAREIFTQSQKRR